MSLLFWLVLWFNGFKHMTEGRVVWELIQSLMNLRHCFKGLIPEFVVSVVRYGPQALISACLRNLEIIKVKIKQSRNSPGVAQSVSGGLGSQISMTFSTWRWWGCQSHAPAAFTPRKCSWYSFSLGAESIPGLCYGRKEYVTEKSSDTTGNRSRDRPTSNAAP